MELRWTSELAGHFDGALDGEVLIQIDTPEPARAGVLVHELFHLLGAGHVEQGAGIMSEHAPRPDRITAADLEALCSSAPCVWLAPEAALPAAVD